MNIDYKKRTYLTLIISIVVLVISRFSGIFISRIISASESTELIEKSLYKLILVVLVIIFMKKSSNDLAFYGFQLPVKIPYFKIVISTIIIIIVSGIMNAITFMGILRNFIHTNGNTPKFNLSLPQIILSIWLWSTFVEEVFSRGFLQSNLTHLKRKKIKLFKLHLSMSAIISAVFFSLMHISNIFYDYDLLFCLTMIANAFWMGLIAAYVREKYDSIYPAILVHFTANVVGTLPKVIKEISSLF